MLTEQKCYGRGTGLGPRNTRISPDVSRQTAGGGEADGIKAGKWDETPWSPWALPPLLPVAEASRGVICRARESPSRSWTDVWLYTSHGQRLEVQIDFPILVKGQALWHWPGPPWQRLALKTFHLRNSKFLALKENHLLTQHPMSGTVEGAGAMKIDETRSLLRGVYILIRDIRMGTKGNRVVQRMW